MGDTESDDTLSVNSGVNSDCGGSKHVSEHVSEQSHGTDTAINDSSRTQRLHKRNQMDGNRISFHTTV